jgi:hypothetical protein
VKAKPNQHLDGVSLTPLLNSPKGTIDRDSIFWHYPHYSNQGGFPGGAIRSGNYKLVERYEDGRTHLFDLNKDPGESIDIANTNKDKVDSMRKQLHTWYKKVDAKFLQPKGENLNPWRP